jgi:uncharacterized membrane protein YgcG
MRNRTLLTTVLILGLVAFAANAAENWVIEDFDVEITINADSSIYVVEIIRVNFDSRQHGIIRDIPYSGIDVEIISTGDEHDRFIPHQLEWASSGGESVRRVRIGDPDAFVSGRETYQIEYVVRGSIEYLADYDELYWNATGERWPVVMNSASATVTLPQAISESDLKLRCFAGDSTSTQENCTFDILDSTTIRYETGELQPGQGLTIVTGIPSGIVDEPTLTGRVLGLLIQYGKYLLLPLIMLLILLRLWFKGGRDPKLRRVKTPQWTPPYDLRPGEIGVIFDEKADLRDVSATIIDFAVRGYMTITRIEEGDSAKTIGKMSRVITTIFGLAFAGFAIFWLLTSVWIGAPWFFTLFGIPFALIGLYVAFGPWIRPMLQGESPFEFEQSDYELTKLKEPDSLMRGFEKELFQAIFKDSESKKLSELENKFYSDLPGIRKSIYEELVSQGFYTRNPNAVRSAYFGIGVAVLVAGFISLLILMNYDPFWGASVIMSGLLIVGFSPIMPQKTKKGVFSAWETDGFRHFLKIAEKERLEFHNSPNRDVKFFERLLPYAISLGVAGEWAEQFKDIYTQPPDWYRGSWGAGGFSSYHLARSLRNFSCNAERACTSAPSSGGTGGGFSGGGFSGGSVGGGRGGGGGGSW